MYNRRLFQVRWQNFLEMVTGDCMKGSKRRRGWNRQLLRVKTWRICCNILQSRKMFVLRKDNFWIPPFMNIFQTNSDSWKKRDFNSVYLFNSSRRMRSRRCGQGSHHIYNKLTGPLVYTEGTVLCWRPDTVADFVAAARRKEPPEQQTRIYIFKQILMLIGVWLIWPLVDVWKVPY